MKPNYADQLELWVTEKLTPKAVVRISALAQTGLEAFLDAIFANAEEGQAFYPEEFYTDQDPSFRIAEIVREQAINRLSEEIPHALYVEVADREVKESPPAEGAKPQETLWLRVFLIVERESQGRDCGRKRRRKDQGNPPGRPKGTGQGLQPAHPP